MNRIGDLFLLPLLRSAPKFGTWFDLAMLNEVLRPFGLVIVHRDRLRDAIRKRVKLSLLNCTCESAAPVCLACDQCPNCAGKVP